MAHFDSGFTAADRERLEIVGNAGRLVLDAPFLAEPDGPPAGITHWHGTTATRIDVPAVDQYALEVDDLVGAILDGTRPAAAAGVHARRDRHARGAGRGRSPRRGAIDLARHLMTLSRDVPPAATPVRRVAPAAPDGTADRPDTARARRTRWLPVVVVAVVVVLGVAGAALGLGLLPGGGNGQALGPPRFEEATATAGLATPTTVRWPTSPAAASPSSIATTTGVRTSTWPVASTPPPCSATRARPAICASSPCPMRRPISRP